jgi:hypothetical protein
MSVEFAAETCTHLSDCTVCYGFQCSVYQKSFKMLYLLLGVGCHFQSRSQTVSYVYMAIQCLVVVLVVHKALLHTLDCVSYSVM